MANRHKIFLTDEERTILDNIAQKGKNSARVIVMSLILLSRDKSPEGQGAKTNARISQELNISERTVESAKRRFVEGGVDSAAQRSPKTVNPNSIKFDGVFEARLVALACSPPPSGGARWTARLLADKLVELDIAPDGVSPMTARRTLKKNETRPHLKKY